jgi:hypothetical protein
VSSPLADFQRAFAAHLRAPASPVTPLGLESRGSRIYHELYFNNLNALLAGNFPVIQRSLGAPAWQALMRNFCQHHRPRTPLFTEIGQEFISFLDHGTRIAAPAWLSELAHYEWIELDLQLSPTIATQSAAEFEPLRMALTLSPLVRLLDYQWPVHRIGPQWQPESLPEDPTLLLARRDGQGNIRFSELSPLSFRLLERVESAPGITATTLLQQLAGEAGLPIDAKFVIEGEQLLARLLEQAALLGSFTRQGQ